MEWFDRCTPRPPRPGVLGPLDVARNCVADAQLALVGALTADWVSLAADGYRARLEARMRDLRARAAALDALEVVLKNAETAHANIPTGFFYLDVVVPELEAARANLPGV